MPEAIKKLESAFRSRPLVWITLAFGAGIWLNGLLLDLAPTIVRALIFLLFAATALLICLPIFGKRPVARAASLLVLLALGLLRGQIAAPRLPYPKSLGPWFKRPGTLFTAHVQAPPDFYPHKTRLILALESAELDGRKVPVQGGVQLSIGKVLKHWTIGSAVAAPLNLKRFHNYGTPGAFDYEWFQGAKGLYARAYLKTDAELIRCDPKGAGLIRRMSVSVAAAVDSRRQGWREWIHGHLDRKAAVLVEALLLGYRHEIAPEFRDALNRAGVSHLLAISGLHLGLVAVALFFFGRKAAGWGLPRLLRRSSDRHPAWGLALVGMALYALISGLALPTWRASLMLTFLAAATFTYRRPDPPSFLAAAALLMLAGNPNALWMVSFQLSFAAFAGIFLVYPRLRPLEKRLDGMLAKAPLRLLRPIVSAFFISLAVNAVILPIVAYHFHGISLAGLLANAVLVPFVGFLVLPLGLLGLFLTVLSPWVAAQVLIVDGWLLEILRHLVLWFSNFSWSYVWIGLLPLWAMAAFYAILVLVLADGPERRGRRVLPGCLLAIALVFGMASFARMPAGSGQLEVDVIDIGQGSSTLLILPHGRTVLVDGGGYWDHSYDIGRNVVAPFLWQRGIRHLDLVILSHDHPDHANGLRFILSQFDVDEYWETGFTERSTGKTVLSEIASMRRLPIRTLGQLPRETVLDDCTLRVLNPDPARIKSSQPIGDLNNLSLVLAVRFKNTQVLVPGDIDRTIEKRLPISNGGIETLLIAPHHGSKRSSCAAFLDRLQPSAVLVSCGFENGFGFPAGETLKRLKARRISVLRTDRCGTIYAFSNGDTWRFRCYSDGSR